MDRNFLRIVLEEIAGACLVIARRICESEAAGSLPTTPEESAPPSRPRPSPPPSVGRVAPPPGKAKPLTLHRPKPAPPRATKPSDVDKLPPDGEELRSLRLSMGWSQMKLAIEWGVTQTAISTWELQGGVPKDLLATLQERLKQKALGGAD